MTERKDSKKGGQSKGGSGWRNEGAARPYNIADGESILNDVDFIDV